MDQNLFNRLFDMTAHMIKASARWRDGNRAMAALTLREDLAARFPQFHENRTSTTDAE